MGVQQRLGKRFQTAEEILRQLDSAWERAGVQEPSDRVGALPLRELEESYRTFSYLLRWSAQLQERLVGLAVR